MPDESIVIAGGGVAGAVLATLLARDGRRVRIVERREAGETKCCGCCLAPRGVQRLRELGLDGVLDEIGATPTRQWRLRGASGSMMLEASLGDLPGAVVSRDRFDSALLDRAKREGALVERGASVRSASDGAVVIQSRSGETVDRIQPWLLVGADGVGSGVARSTALAAPVARSTRGSAQRRRLGFSWLVSSERARALAVEPETIEIYLAHGGYLGLVQSADGVCAAALGEGAAPGALVRSWAGRSSALEAVRDCEPMEAADFAAAGPLPWRPRAVARGENDGPSSVALVGDAAGYEQPFTGEGMTWAIESAALLATSIRTLSRWSSVAASAYARDHARAFALRRWRLRTIARLGETAARSPAWQRCLSAAGRIPFIPGAIVRSVVAA